MSYQLLGLSFPRWKVSLTSIADSPCKVFCPLPALGRRPCRSPWIRDSSWSGRRRGPPPKSDLPPAPSSFSRSCKQCTRPGAAAGGRERRHCRLGREKKGNQTLDGHHTTLSVFVFLTHESDEFFLHGLHVPTPVDRGVRFQTLVFPSVDTEQGGLEDILVPD